MAMLDVALSYANRGWPVFPLEGKRPRTAHGVRDATLEKHIIVSWWTRWPNADIGIACGGSLVVLDVDIKNGLFGEQSLKKLFPDGPPKTYAVRTGTGGWHYYFLGAGIRTRHGLIGPEDGLDLQGEGAYVVAPPSVHPDTKRRYEILHDGPLAPLPEILREAGTIRRPATQAELHGEITQNRNVTLTKRAGLLRANGASDEELLSLLLAINERECKPPLEESEVRIIARSATRWEQGPPLIEDVPIAEFKDTQTVLSLTGATGTDLYLIERLEHLVAGNLKYRESTGQTLCWANDRWHIENSEAPIFHAAMCLGPELWEEAETADSKRKASIQARLAGGEEITAETQADTAADERIKRMFKYAVKAQSVGTMSALVRGFKAIPRVRVDATDTNSWLFGLANGVLDCKTGKLTPVRREDLITRYSEVKYDPTTTAPHWENYLQRVIPEPEHRAFLQRLFGYSLTGDISEQIAPFLYGPPQSGKSTCIITLMSLLGPYGATGSADLLSHGQRHPEELAALENKRAVLLAEMNAERIKESRFKQLVSGEELNVRGMRENSRQMKPSFKLWLTGNDKPNIRDSGGVWRRLRLLEFNQVIPEAEKNKHLDQILRAELSGILNWAIAGCLDWQKNGLQTPQRVLDATEEYREEQDDVGRFVKEECVLEPFARAVVRDLYIRFQDWCKTEGLRWVMSKRAFGTEMTKLFGPSKSYNGGDRFYVGVRHINVPNVKPN